VRVMTRMVRCWPWAAAACLVVTLAGACSRRSSTLANVPTVTVGRQDIVVTVEATGTVEPINLVEVKSKASGAIVKLPVDVGSVVHRGDLLAQIDPRNVQSQYDQATAALASAQAKLEVARAQRKRADDLFAAQAMAAVDHETAILADASAQSDLVQARSNLDIAKQALDDATVRAPIDGTILAKDVSAGQVISSATMSVSGGTTLLDMADLSSIRVRSFVSETDIGRVRPGQPASVAIDAYPRRSFRGTVEKIEPQAVVQQSITMFPVLVSLSNEEGLLLPGMNGEVTVLVDQRNDVLSVPLDAVRTARELTPLAPVLHLDPDSLKALAAAGTRPGAGPSRLNADPAASGGRWTGGGARGVRGGAGADSTGARRRFRGAGADSTRRRAMGGNGGEWAAGGGGGRANAAQIAVVKTAQGLAPRVVHLGLSNYDDAQVLDGLAPGDQVVMLSVVELQQQRTQNMDRMRQRAGGLPGMGGGGGGGGAGAGGGRPAGR